MVIPIGVVTGSGRRSKAIPATRNALCKRLRGFKNFLNLLVCLICHPHLQGRPAIGLVTRPG
jgi:hypothetical protein